MTSRRRSKSKTAAPPPVVDALGGPMTPAQEALIQREGQYRLPPLDPPVAPVPALAVAGMGAFDADEYEPKPDPTAEAQQARVWSEQQQAIFSWFARKELRYRAPQSRHLVVRARAGTGKTTTILEAISRAPERRILLAAFNRSIAVELQERLNNPNAEAATLHAIGYRCVRQYWGGIGTDEKRAITLAEAVCENGDYPQAGRVPVPIQRIIAKLHTKVREIDPKADEASAIRDIAVLFDCVPDDDWRYAGFTLSFVCERAIEAIRLAAASRPAAGIDFADMIFLPIRNRWLVPRYDLVVIDEAQDMSASQLEIAQGVMVEGGRIAVVGDDRQAVYGFRGADSTSLDRLKDELGAIEMGLNTTYRCGKTIVAEAQRLVPDILAHESNGDGTVQRVSYETMMAQAEPGDFILSRVNAPLVRAALALIRAQRRVRIQGRDIGANLKSVSRRLTQGNSTMSMREWYRRLMEWEKREIAKAEEADIISRAEYAMEQAATLRALAEDAERVGDVESRIDTLFADNGYGQIVCSSVHRAKGLETNRVWALRSTFYPPVACRCGHRHQFGKQTCSRCRCSEYRPVLSKQREEENIGYVAITRAKRELCWVVEAQ